MIGGGVVASRKDDVHWHRLVSVLLHSITLQYSDNVDWERKGNLVLKNLLQLSIFSPLLVDQVQSTELKRYQDTGKMGNSRIAIEQLRARVKRYQNMISATNGDQSSTAFDSLRMTSIVLLDLCRSAEHYAQELKRTLRVFGRPYYRSSLWYSVSSVCLSSVTFCIVAKRCILAKKCLKE